MMVRVGDLGVCIPYPGQNWLLVCCFGAGVMGGVFGVGGNDDVLFPPPTKSFIVLPASRHHSAI
jgi:hypothetical protein